MPPLPLEDRAFIFYRGKEFGLHNVSEIPPQVKATPEYQGWTAGYIRREMPQVTGEVNSKQWLDGYTQLLNYILGLDTRIIECDTQIKLWRISPNAGLVAVLE